MIELEKCPCCKDYGFLKCITNNITDIDAISLYFVQCSNPECKIRTPYGTIEEVTKIWNRRN